MFGRSKYRNMVIPVVSIMVIMLMSFLAGCGATTPKTDFPTKDISFIVPMSPGGGYDTYSRLLAQYMPKYLPKQVNIIVKNVTGGDNKVGIGEINRSKPDGYTLGIFSIPGNVVNQLLGADYDLNKMTWLGNITDTNYAGGLSQKSKFKNLKDMQNAPEVKVGLAGTASTTCVLAFQEMGIKAKYINHNGSTDAIMAAVRGDVDYVQFPYSTMKKFIVDSKELNPMVVYAPERIKGAADIPTIKELGYEKLLDVVQLQYLVGGPPGIPADVAKILRDAFQKTMKDPEFLKKMEDAGQVAHPSDDKGAAKIITDNLEMFSKSKDLLEQVLAK